MKSQRTYFTWSFAFLSVVLMFLVGCLSQRPRVYRNAHLQEVGEEQAEKDVVVCEKLAGDHLSQSNAREEVVGKIAVGGAFGAASSESNPAYQNFVNRCLQEAGYEPTG